ncbi:MAG: T9SS type A sorting domain-containing protein [Bacteroidales bacterium]|nr:T9SS type A sorting domain-containing protein [Bacteroidales bacterium]
MKKSLFISILSILLICNQNGYSQIDLNEGLILHYSLDGNAVDNSSGANDGVVSSTGAYGTTDANGIKTKAMLFNGTYEQGMITCPAELMNNLTEFSLSYWFNLSSLTNGMSLVGQDNVLETGFYTSSNRIVVYHPTSGGVSVPLTSVTEQWNHLSISCSGTEMKIYLNGVLVNTLTGNYSLTSSVYPPRIGGNVVNQSDNSWLRGKVDEVRFYNRVLNVDEINLLSSVISLTFAISSVSETSLCAGESLNVSYTILGSGIETGNNFYLQLSDENGYFDNPIVLAEQTGTSSGTFSGVILPEYLKTGDSYKLRIVGDLPIFQGTVSSSTLSIFNPSEGLSTLEYKRMLYYKFDGNTNDFSGNSQNGTAVGGCSYVDDRFGNSFSAMQMNGTTGHVVVPEGVWFDSGPFSASVWVKPISFISWSRIFDFGKGENNENVVWALSQSTTGKQFLSIRQGSTEVTTLAGTVSSLNEWNHLATVFDGSTASVYINGVKVATTTSSGARLIFRNINYIGRSNWSTDSYANAVFDDFSIWKRALSESEIKVLAFDGMAFSNSPVCDGNSIFLEAADIPGASYVWSGPAFSANGRTQEIQSVAAANGGRYYVTISDGLCSYIDSTDVTVVYPGSQASVSFSGLPSTTYTGASSVTLTGSPAGGYFSGLGISASVFNPSTAGVGTHSIVYSYMNTGGCVSTYSQEVEVGEGINMENATITACQGGFFDSGGNTANYLNNENSVITFCSGTGDPFRFQFTSMSIGTGDTLWAYDGPTVNDELIAIYIAYSNTDYIWSSGDNITFKFKSDGSSTTSGWEAQYWCMEDPSMPAEITNMSTGFRTVCSGTFRDPGGSGNYSVGTNVTQTFKSSDGNRLKLLFTMLNINGNNGGHWLSVYDGPTTAYPLIGSYNEWAWPPSSIVESTGEYLTFNFNSTNTSAGSRPGWEATWECTTPPLQIINIQDEDTQVCEGVFYDNGGPNANYLSNSNESIVLSAEPGKILYMTFNHNNTQFGSGDTLWVYDGNISWDNLKAMYISSSRMDPIYSSGSSLTFVFKSDGTGGGRGWQAYINCVDPPANAVTYNMSTGIRAVCNGTFRDPGGSSNYSVGTNVTQTFKSADGERLKLLFTMLNINGNNGGHWLSVYDGPTTAYPLIGSYNEWAWPPSSMVESTGEYITFNFNSTNTSAGTRPGWEGTWVCTTPVLTHIYTGDDDVSICDAVIYDHAGPAVNYSANRKDTTVVCSDNDQLLQVIFNHNETGLASGDTLWIYDGNSVLSPPLGMYITSSRIDQIVSSGTCLTFVFSSNATSQSRGYQGVISCITVPPAQISYNMSSGVRYVCNGKFLDPGGTSNYPDGVYTQTYTSYSGERLRFTRNSFDCNGNNGGHPISVYDGPSTASPLIGTYTNYAYPPAVFESTGSSLTFHFNSTNTMAGNTAGWDFSISCFTESAIDVAWINSPLCAGETVDIPYILNDVVNSGNVFTAQLSDASGSFSSPTNIGTITSTESGTISATIPGGTISGSNYRIRVVSNDPPMLGSQSPNPVVIIANPTAPVISAVGATTFCQNTGSVTLSTTAQSGVNYQWIRDGAVNVGSNSNIFTGTYGGIYTLEVSNTCSTVSSSNSIELAEEYPLSEPLITAAGATDFCNGESVELSVEWLENVSWQWTLDGINTGTNSNILDATSQGVYSISANNSCGSVNSSNQITITHLTPAPVSQLISASGATEFCEGSNVELSVGLNSGSSYQWYLDGIAFGTDINTITVSEAGEYSLTETNECGYANSANTVQIVVNSAPQTPTFVANGATSFCNGGSVELESENFSGQHYQWYLNGTPVFDDNHIVIASNAGTYTLSSWNDCGTVSSPSSVEVVVLGEIPASPIITASGSTSFCEGGSVVLSSNSSSGFLWSNGAVTSEITVSESGTYFAYEDGGSGCISAPSNSIEVIVYSNPVANISSSAASICPGETGVFLSSDAAETYEWIYEGTATGFNTQTIEANNPGTYELIVTNVNSCSDNTIFELLEGATPIVNLVYSGTEFCEGSSLELSVSGSDLASFVWMNESGVISGAISSTYYATSAGEYYAEVTNTQGCAGLTETVSIYELPLPLANIVANTTSFCSGDYITITANFVSGASYELFRNGISLGAAGLDNIFDVYESGAYYVEVEDVCVNTSNTIIISENTVPSAAGSISGVNQFCPGEVLSFSVPTSVGADYYHWQIIPSTAGSISSGQGSTGIVVAMTNTGATIRVTPRNECGDGVYSNYSVSPYSSGTCDWEVMFAGIPTNICSGNSVTFYNYTNASYFGGFTPTWSFGSGAVPSTATGNGPHTVTYNTIGNKTVVLEYIDAFGYPYDSETKTNYIVVGAPVNTSAITGNVLVACNGSIATYSVVETAGSTYQWTVPAGATIVSGQGTHEIEVEFSGTAGAISVVETGVSGCTGSAVTINVECDDVSINHLSSGIVKLYPNPGSGIVTLESEFDFELIEIYDISGRKVNATNITGRKQNIDLSYLSSGVYNVRIIAKKEVVVEILVIDK